MGLIADASSLMALRRDPYMVLTWLKMTTTPTWSGMKATGCLTLCWQKAGALNATLQGEKVLQRLDEIDQELGAMHVICETMLRRSEECIASTCEDSEEQQSDFERTEDSDSQGRWDTNFGEMWTSL